MTRERRIASGACNHAKMRSALLYMPGENGHYLSKDRQIMNAWTGEVPEVEWPEKIKPEWRPWLRELDQILKVRTGGVQYGDLLEEDQERLRACFNLGLSPEEAVASYEDVE
jgi:hypothetical protein